MAVRRARQKSLLPILLSWHISNSSPNILVQTLRTSPVNFFNSLLTGLCLPFVPLMATLHTAATTLLKCEPSPC